MQTHTGFSLKLKKNLRNAKRRISIAAIVY